MSSLNTFVLDLQAADRPPGDRRAGHDRRAAERRSRVHPLESRETRLRFAAQAVGFGTYDLDWITGDSQWSPELRTIAGLPPGGPPLATAEIEALLHPEDRPGFLETLRAALRPRGSGVFEAEHRILRPDGAVRWVRTKGRTFFIGAGRKRRPLATTGIVMDITASRAAEAALLESREELDQMVAAAIDCIITIDDDQRIVRFNPAAARMFGCTPEEVLGQGLDRFIPERYRQSHADKVRLFAEGQVPAQSLEAPRRFSGLRANGEEFPFEATVTKVKVDGRCRMTTFMRDITDRVQVEEALRRSKEDLELAVRGGNIGIWHLDMDSREVEWSDRNYQLFGIPPGEPLTYERIMAAVHPDDRPSIEAEARRAREERLEYNAEYRVIWPDGSIHWLASVGRCLYGEDGRGAVGMRGITFEITRRKLAEEALQQSKAELAARVEERTAELVRANEALERSNLELQQFAFIAAHDLQTPLRSISGFAQLLEKDYGGRFDARADLWLRQLVHSAQRMHELVRDLLAYSRVESRGGSFQPVPFNDVLADVADFLAAPIRESGARITWDDLPTVMGDRTQLVQVVQNLVDNGLKYRGAEPPRIHVSAARAGHEWVFSVRDNGIGMAEKHLEPIFDIFRRLHTQQAYPGTGIGLAVCRRVIHRHGGRIWAESKPGEGSTFHFTLPDRPGEATEA